MLSPRKETLPVACPFVMEDELYLDHNDLLYSNDQYKNYANKALETLKFTDVYTIDDSKDDWKSIHYYLNKDEKGKIRSPRKGSLIMKKVIIIKLKKIV